MWAGLLSALLALVGILAAQSSINDLKGRWLAAAVPADDHPVPPFSGPLQSLGARLNTFGLCAVLVAIWAVALNQIAGASDPQPKYKAERSLTAESRSPASAAQLGVDKTGREQKRPPTSTPAAAPLPTGTSASLSRPPRAPVASDSLARPPSTSNDYSRH